MGARIFEAVRARLRRLPDARARAEGQLLLVSRLRRETEGAGPVPRGAGGRPGRVEEQRAALANTAGVANEQQVYEARREAAPPLLLVAALLVLLAVVSEVKGWNVLYLPRRSWLVPAVVAHLLIGDLWTGTSGPTLVTSRPVAVVLLLFVVLGNLVALGFLIAGLVDTKRGHLGGGELLLTAAVIWITNVVAFGLLFWEVA